MIVVLWCENLGISDIGQSGGKAANLGECVRAGLPVPRGFVVSTRAYRQVIDPMVAELTHVTKRGEAEAARALVLAAHVPEEIRHRIAVAYQQLGQPPVAVRSSATAEDLVNASFAGQQDTYLNVQGIDDVLVAVHRCWASLWSDRAVAYRAQQEVGTDDLALAVVIQEMVAPDVSGVLFTRNPVTGDTSKMLVSASYGLGESVVSALVTPDTFEIARESGSVTQREIGTKKTRIDAAPRGTVSSEVPQVDRERPCLTDAQLLKLRNLGERVEKHYGRGQDVEWAFVGQELYLLQARPITTDVAMVPGHEPVHGRFATFLRNDFIEHFPGPYPLDLVSIRSLISGAATAFGLTTVDPSTLIGGDDDGVIRLTLADFNPAGAFIRNLPRTLYKAFHHDPFAWPDEEQALRRELDAMARTAKNLDSRADAEVLHLMHEAVGYVGSITRDRFLNYLVPMMARRNNAMALIKLARLGSAMTTEDLYAGVPYKTAEITAALKQLADTSRELNVANTIISAPQGKVTEALESSPESREFLTVAHAFLAEFGARTARLYLPFSNQSWREDPEIFYALLAASLRGEYRTSEHSGDTALHVEQCLPRPLRRFWRKNTAQIRAMHIGREGTVYLIEEFLCVARTARNEIARRLVERGQLAHPDDLKFLYIEEVTAALESASTPSQSSASIATQRRRRRAIAESVWWNMGESTSPQYLDGRKPEPDSAAFTQLTGSPASVGLAHGPARIVRSPADFHLLQPGDILVCPYTDPTWTPLFSLAAAVVAETGGPLSHAAIVAREYGIPAVLGVNGATNLQPGTELTVDGGKGTVSVRSL